MSASKAFLDRLVDEGLIAGGVAVIEDRPSGGDDPITDVAVAGEQWVGGPQLTEGAIFRIQSMTKAVTAVATLSLVEHGALALDDPVDRWLPELADRQVLREVYGPLDDTEPARDPITVRHLLTCTSGYGMGAAESPLGRAMTTSGVEAGPHPYGIGADEWLGRLAALPLAHQPGAGWRYHHSFSILGVLLARAVDRPLDEHLRADVLGPIGMTDTGFSVPDADLERLPAGYRLTGGTLVETEPAGGGANAGDPGYAPWHEELVSTASDYLAFARMLRDRGVVDGAPYLSAESVALMTSDQVPDAAKTSDSFGAEFWDGTGWGFGLGIESGGSGSRRGRFGWSGGQGTDFSVDSTTGRITLLLTQTELGEATMPAFLAFRDA